MQLNVAIQDGVGILGYTVLSVVHPNHPCLWMPTSTSKFFIEKVRYLTADDCAPLIRLA